METNTRKQKLLLLFFASIQIVYLNAQNINNKGIGDEISEHFKYLNKSEIKTGLLHDMVLPFIKMEEFDGINDSISANSDLFQQAYLEMYNAAVDTPVIRADIDKLMAKAYEYYAKDINPIAIIDMKYNRIKHDALDKKLIKLQNNYLYDVKGRKESPYDEKNLLVAASLIDWSYGNPVKYYFGEEFYFTNRGKKPVGLLVDFDDGQGYRSIGFGETVNISYSTVGNKKIKIKAKRSHSRDHDGTYHGDYGNIPGSWMLDQRHYTLNLDPPDDVVYLTADIPYDPTGTSKYPYAFGRAYIKYASGNTDKKLKRPFIVCEGIDFPVINNKDDYIYGEFGWPVFVDGKSDRYPQLTQLPEFNAKLDAAGYDIILLDYQYGADFIQKNAFLLVKLIQWVNQNKTSNEQNVVTGISMGGQVAKYALSYMEKNNLPHCTRLYGSMDSPHQKANIPLGLQYFVDYFASGTKCPNARAKDSKARLSTPAAMQLLDYHFNPAVSIIENAWETDRNNMGYPQFLRKISVANGSGNGTSQGFSSGNKLIELHQCVWWGLGLACVDGHVYALTGASVHGNNNVVFWGDRPSQSSVIKTVPSTYLQYDHAPGGKHKGLKDVGDAPAKKCSGFAPDAINFYDYSCFIPTISALDINTTDLFLNIKSNLPIITSSDDEGLDKENNYPPSSLTPFDAIYAPIGSNEQHSQFVTGAEANKVDGNIEWMLSQLEHTLHSGTVLTNAYYNFGRGTDKTISDVTIGSNAILYVNGNLKTGLNGQFIEPVANSFFTLYTSNCSSCASSIKIINNGKLVLGDMTANTSGSLVVRSGGVIDNINGVIEINNSQLKIEKGGTLVLRAGATLRIKGWGNVRVENGGYIAVEQGAIIILQDKLSELNMQTGSLRGVANSSCTGGNVNWVDPCLLSFSGSGRMFGYALLNIGPDLIVNYNESITLSAPSGATAYGWSMYDNINGWTNYSTNQTITISNITNNFLLDLVVIYPSGCNGYDRVKITVNCPPVTLTPTSRSICKGCKITLTATTLLSDAIYTWCERKNNQPEVCMGKIGNPNFATFEPKTTTTYRVEVTSPSLGCTVSSQEVTITINPDCACYNPHPPHSELACGGSGTDNDNLIGSPNGHVFHQSAQLANTEKVFEGEIRVAKNATLRIENSTIYMRECSRIIVEGRMEVINSQLKGCENARWKGVEVRGNKNLEQIPGNQGTMLIEGSIIADAEIGILLGQRNGQTFDMNSGGGILEMRGGNVMERNKIHVKELPFEKPNHSIIEFTEFRELFKGGASQCVLISAPRHIHMEKINGMKIHNNTFMGEDLGIHLQESKNFIIKENYFNETKVAVKTENSPLSDMGSDISDNHFIKSQNAIEFNSDNHMLLKVYCNEFWDYSDYGVLSINTQLADQGTLQKGAGNSYNSVSTQTNHSWAHQGNTMNYFHNPSNPINLTAGNGYTANAVAAQQDNTCGVIAKTSNIYSTINSNKETEDDELTSSEDFGKYQLSIYPNPFNHQTNIIYTLIEPQEVTLFITNIHGQIIDKLIEGKKQEAGCYKLTYDATHLAPGIYYYTLQAGGVYIETKKMGVLR